jgi:23S rRNA maturation-related 3'-5' exoribonuclease YhaM
MAGNQKPFNYKTIETEIEAFDEEFRRTACELQQISLHRNMCLSEYRSPKSPHEEQLEQRLRDTDRARTALIHKRGQQVFAALEYLRDSADKIANPKLRKISHSILVNKQFIKCPAARHQHQAYDGGLVVHTAEVLEAAMLVAQARFIDVNTDVIITATIFHDYGKIWDYVPAKQVVSAQEKQERYDYTLHQKLIRHLPRSYAVFMEMADREGDDIPEEIKTQIGHCILSHHGRNEWGSPVEPMTPEAHAIHFADMMSANCAKDYYTRD